MHYDQSWMGYGMVGGLQAGAIAAVVGLLLFGVLRWFGERNEWGNGRQLAWTYLITLALTASGDLWDLVYFSYGQLQSLQLLKVKLAGVHDPDGIGARVMCEFIGGVVGVYVGWVLFARLGLIRSRTPTDRPKIDP
ncbi:hypothetical protein [Dyella silvatica]|uniref:hypothetical protein n=1 Tax=Dyella silvatica TaxID=2992128 RepID=UPI00225162D8|nr:hypothetical protein [Dyella silvatica]